MGFRTQFRDKQEWLDSTNGTINLNTASDGCAKNYDSLVTQFCGWYQDEETGGMDDALRRMIEYDSEFVLGLAFELQLRHMGALECIQFDHSLKMLYDNFEQVVKQKSDILNEHEKLHVEVVRLWTQNKLHDATKVLERIITLYPDDVSSLKMCQDLYFVLGPTPRMRNSPSYALKAISDKNPLKGYCHGMFAFALEESNMYEQSKQEALAALELIPNDTWAIHNYAHCLEMEAKVEEGLKWMKDKQCDWLPCGTLASHQYWHTALFHINNKNFDEAIGLLDTEVLSRCSPGCTSLDLHDSVSMVYRMELINLFEKQGKTDKDRWEDLYSYCRPYRNSHLFGFNDAHFMMAILGKGDLDAAQEMVDSLEKETGLGESQPVVKPLLEAMIAFKQGKYARTVDLLEPIRFEIIKIGGSHAQRDVFEQLLLVAALRSDEAVHNKLAERIIKERENFHGRIVPQTELLVEAGRKA